MMSVLIHARTHDKHACKGSAIIKKRLNPDRQRRKKERQQKRATLHETEQEVKKEREKKTPCIGGRQQGKEDV